MPDRRYADEWLPSRFSLGTFRVVAFIIASLLERRRPSSGAYLNREPRQHPLEAYTLAVAYWMIPTTHFTMLIMGRTAWSWIAAVPVTAVLLVAVPLAWVLIALAFSPVAAAVERFTARPTHDVQALVIPTGILVLSTFSIVRHWPSGKLGWIWIALTAVELVASIFCLALRGRFEALAERLPSEAP